MIMNMPSGGNDSTLIWNISDKLHGEVRGVSTMPRSITNGYVVKLNDIFYMIGGDTTSGTALPSYKYVNGAWVEDTVLGAVSINKSESTRNYLDKTTGGVVSNNNKIYYTQYGYGSDTEGFDISARAIIYGYDGNTRTTNYRYFGSSYRYGTVAIAISSNEYKTLALADGKDNMGSGYDLYSYSLKLGGVSSTNRNVLKSDVFACESTAERIIPHCQGVHYAGYWGFLVSRMSHTYYNTKQNQTNYQYYFMLVDSVGTVNFCIELPDSICNITDMVVIGDYIYFTYKTNRVIRWSINTLKWERVVSTSGMGGSLVLHDGEIHCFYSTVHKACKLYRIAKSYAPKGTKIYLPYEASATSTNLKPIEGGFEVTESGNVELKLYESLL